MLQDVLVLNWLNSLLASCSLIDLDFLLLHTAHFDRSIILPLFVFETFGFLHFVSVLHFRQCDNIVIYLCLSFQIFINPFFLLNHFISSNSFVLFYQSISLHVVSFTSIYSVSFQSAIIFCLIADQCKLFLTDI